MKTFLPLNCSTYLFTCALPLNLDPYRDCQFQCEYCFMKNRTIGVRQKDRLTPNIKWLKNKFKKVYDDKNVTKTNLIETLLSNRIDLHCGTKTDPFQPQEKEKQYTKQIIDLCNEYEHNIVFTTKSNTYHDVDVNPEKHCFQFSITNHYNDRFLEPNVPTIQERAEFYKQLKDEGFKVGIRFEPFIPNVTDVKKCLQYFDDPDIVHIAKLNMSSQKVNENLIHYIGCERSDFISTGKTHMKLDLLYYNYLQEVFDYLEENGFSYSARNPYIGNNNCCCGDTLVHKSNTFDPLHLVKKYNKYTMENGLYEMGNVKQCDMRPLFTSNRKGDCITCEDFYRDRFNKRLSKFNPKYIPKFPKKTKTLDKYIK